MTDEVVYRGFTAAELESQYSARAAVPEHPQIFERWLAESLAFRAEARCRLDLAYGPGERERLDLFLPEHKPAPVLLFIHGGYWQAMEKGFFSFLARELVSAGAAVAVMNYDLCPAVTLDRIVDQSRAVLVWLHQHGADQGLDAWRIHICGHSAGGHLAAMLMATDWPACGLPADIVGSALSISGLFDLEPLVHTAINDALGLDIDTALRNSPLFLYTSTRAPFVAAVGDAESAEFHRQSLTLVESWRARGADTAFMALPGLNHFTAVEQLAVPGSGLLARQLRLMGLESV